MTLISNILNQRVKYMGHLVQKLFSEHADTQKRTGPIALPGPLKWSVATRIFLHNINSFYAFAVDSVGEGFMSVHRVLPFVRTYSVTTIGYPMNGFISFDKTDREYSPDQESRSQYRPW